MYYDNIFSSGIAACGIKCRRTSHVGRDIPGDKGSIDCICTQVLTCIYKHSCTARRSHSNEVLTDIVNPSIRFTLQFDIIELIKCISMLIITCLEGIVSGFLVTRRGHVYVDRQLWIKPRLESVLYDCLYYVHVSHIFYHYFQALPMMCGAGWCWGPGVTAELPMLQRLNVSSVTYLIPTRMTRHDCSGLLAEGAPAWSGTPFTHACSVTLDIRCPCWCVSESYWTYVQFIVTAFFYDFHCYCGPVLTYLYLPINDSGTCDNLGSNIWGLGNRTYTKLCYLNVSDKGDEQELLRIPHLSLLRSLYCVTLILLCKLIRRSQLSEISASLRLHNISGDMLCCLTNEYCSSYIPDISLCFYSQWHNTTCWLRDELVPDLATDPALDDLAVRASMTHLHRSPMLTRGLSIY